MRHSQPTITRLRALPQQRVKAPTTDSKTRTGYLFAIGAVAILSLSYNALIAMAGGAGMNITPGSVMIFEGLILAAALGLVLLTPFGADDIPSLLLIFVGLMFTLYLSAANEVFYPDTMRNYTIIALFTMLGLRCNFKAVNIIFLTASLLVLAVLLFEMFDLKGYVDTFQPAQYFWKTRGLPIPYWDKSGLFSNALGFKDRFTFGISSHRTSSLFLEQISHANFASLLLILALSCWKRFTWWQRFIYVGTIVMIVTSTSTRTSLTLALAAPLGYFLYPHMPRFLNITIAPLFIIIAFVVGDPTIPHLMTDDFVGRVSWTASTLYRLDLSAAMGQNLAKASSFMDSGFVWVIYTGTLFSMLIIWTFVCCYVPQVTTSQKRFGYALSLFVASSLLVAGTAVFSIKVAGLMWLLAGFMRGQRIEIEGPDDTPAKEDAPSPPSPVERRLYPVKAQTT